MKKYLRRVIIYAASFGIITAMLLLLPGYKPVFEIAGGRLNTSGAYPESNEHPYGKPVKGPLMWESSEAFLKLCTEHNARFRMAAFMTILPDPLPGEEYNVAKAAELLAGTIVKPGEVFSMNARLGPYTKDRGFKEGPTYNGTDVITTIGGGVCKIATTLYNVAVLSDLKIIERRPHGMLVPYVPPGQDATVSYGSTDFKFKNNTGHPIVIWAGTRGNTLYIAFYGNSKPPKVTWHHQILNWQDTYTVYRYNRNLGPGEKKVIIPGEPGLSVKSWLTVEYPDGKTVTKQLGISYYKPMPQVVERGFN